MLSDVCPAICWTIPSNMKKRLKLEAKEMRMSWIKNDEILERKKKGNIFNISKGI